MKDVSMSSSTHESPPRELVPVASPPPQATDISLFDGSPADVVRRASDIAGTLADIILKRIIKRIFRPSSLLPARRDSDKKKPAKILEREEDENMEPEAHIESETFVLRRIRMRRRRGSD